jgi:O-antigen/teichoic acid export membrane protein
MTARTGGVPPLLDGRPPSPPPSRPGRPEQLGRRVARGSVVTLAGQLSQIVLQLTSVIVLARLLSPHDYGLYAMVLVIAGVGEIVRDFGLSSAAVQARTLSRGQRDNLFWINTALGLLLTAVVFAGAPLVAGLFGQHQLVAMTRLLSVIFLVNGVTSQFRADLNRRMRFGAIALGDLAGQVVTVSVAITCAALGARYWALVGSQVASVLTVLAVCAVAARWRPRAPDRSADVRALVRYGRHFVAAQLVNYASNNLDSATIGVRFGARPLGLYNRAFQLVMNPLNQLRTPATTVALPVLSRLQDDRVRADDYVRRGQIVIGYTIVAGLGFAVGAASPLVHLLLGGRWTGVTTIFVLLATAAVFQMLAFVGYWIYLSRGLTRER